jgi:MraZ protein
LAFQGRHHLKMDQKGRFRLPSSFLSEGSDDGFVITNSLYKGEKCLDLYTHKAWKKVESKMSELPQFEAHVQAFQRFYISSAQNMSKDAQDRLLIPTQLREFAGLESEIVAIGMGHKIELWNESSWQKIFLDIATNYDDILKSISGLQQEKKS